LFPRRSAHTAAAGCGFARETNRPGNPRPEHPCCARAPHPAGRACAGEPGRAAWPAAAQALGGQRRAQSSRPAALSQPSRLHPAPGKTGAPWPGHLGADKRPDGIDGDPRLPPFGLAGQRTTADAAWTAAHPLLLQPRAWSYSPAYLHAASVHVRGLRDTVKFSARVGVGCGGDCHSSRVVPGRMPFPAYRTTPPFPGYIQRAATHPSLSNSRRSGSC